MASIDLPVTSEQAVAESRVSAIRPPASRRLDYIDALRGFACLAVMIGHAYAFHPTKPGLIHLPYKLLVNVADIGWLGVSLFLVLSGFCLYYPLVCKKPDLAITLDLPSYALRRCLRILPPYYAVVFGLILLGHIGAHFSEHSALHSLAGLGNFGGTRDILAHIFMVFNLSPSTIGSVVTAFWSLALEFQLYIIFPLLIWLIARRGLRTTLMVTFLIALVWQIVVCSRIGLTMWGSPDMTLTRMTWYYALPSRCFEFVAGMTAAALVARHQVAWQRPAMLTILALILPCLYYVEAVSCFGPLITQAWGVIFACTIFLMSFIPESRFHSALSLRRLVRLGVISYTTYLIHMPIFSLLTSERFHLNHRGEPGTVLLGILQILVVIGVAFLVYKVIEAPFIRMGKAVGRRSKSVSEGRRGANLP